MTRHLARRSAAAFLTLSALTACSGGGGVETTPAPAANPTTVRVTGSGGSATAINLSMVDDGPGVLSRTVAGSVDDVFAALPAVYDSLGIPLTDRDASTHIVGNSGFNTRRRLGKTPLGRYFDCGSTQGAPSVDSYDIHLSVLSKVQPGPSAGLSTITTIVEVLGRPAAFSGEYVRCSTNGVLEQRIVDAVKARLRG